ncbi:serine/threonine-protein kinase [Streptacidiphilus sp. MAP12-33]|uniref:serine/threonine-protein kinase n=1 Tax=Streptacidiphilus sp. MAP12-33 TaxID=3156266 RepID=UPI00351283B6
MRPVGSKYLLEEPLGRGATGTVWRARVREDAENAPVTPGAVVAIKVLKEELATDPDVVMRFLRERAVLLRLVHPNIVRVRDLVVEGELLALVMDLVDGPDLYRYLRENGPLSPVAGALLMAQIADALAASHHDGVVHRDLKPANVLLATVQGPAGPVMHPLLTDFGIARLADSPGLTRTAEFVGTPAYVAPESAEGREQTPAVDVYGAGIMLYELLTGQPPFHGDGPIQILHAHLSQRPERPASVPEPLWTVLERCLEKDPVRRPTATALATALRTVAAGVGVHATPAQIEAANAVGVLLSPPAYLPNMPGAGSDDPTVPRGVPTAGADGTPLVPGQSEDARTMMLGRGATPVGAADPTQVLAAQGFPAGAGDPTTVLPQGAGQGTPGGHPVGAADPTQVLAPQGFGAGAGQGGYGGTPYGAADPTAVLPQSGQAAPERTRVMPTAATPQGAAAPVQDGPHPWESQLRKARERNEQTQVAGLGDFAVEDPFAAGPQVAPPPYRSQPQYQQPQYQQPQPQPQPQSQPPQRQQQPQAPAPQISQARRQAQPPVAPRPYQERPQRERGYEERRPEPARRPEPVRRAPEREREPDYDRAPERARERAPRPPRRRLPRIPGMGCLKVLIFFVVVGFLVWRFSPLHGWIDHGLNTVHGWWAQVVTWYHDVTGAANQVDKVRKSVPKIPSSGN